MRVIYREYKTGWRLRLLCAALVFIACCKSSNGTNDSKKEDKKHTYGEQQAGSQVVSTVNGVAITLSDVNRVARQTGFSAREALAKLQAELLLAERAEALGFRDDPAVEFVTKQAEVQALLTKDVEPVEVTKEEIEKAYEKDDAYRIPESRRSLSVLAKIEKNADSKTWQAGEMFARNAIRAFQSSPDIEGVFERFKSTKSSLFRVIAEKLPATPRNGHFVKEFENALFNHPTPGVLPDPVRTIYGWHAIVLLEIVPSKTISLEEVTDALRKKIATNKRKAALEDLVRTLRRRTRVIRNESAIEFVLTPESIVANLE
jgi:hypothetical protein